jgi:hypothetical protein
MLSSAGAMERIFVSPLACSLMLWDQSILKMTCVVSLDWDILESQRL